MVVASVHLIIVASYFLNSALCGDGNVDFLSVLNG